MTGANSRENGDSHSVASTSGADSDSSDTAGQGDAERFATSAVPGFGGATVWPSWPGVARPAGWFLPTSGEAAPPAGPGMESARPGISDYADNPARDTSPWNSDDASSSGSDSRRDTGPQWNGGPQWYEGSRWDDDSRWDEPAPTSASPAVDAPVVRPTAAQYGRAGGPGFDVPEETVDEAGDSSPRSGWQVAQGVWQGSGVSWEQQPATAPAFLSAPTFADVPVFASAPTYADAPPLTRPEPVVAGTRLPSANADELYRAWHASVRAASASPTATSTSTATPRATVPRHHLAWRVSRVGIPTAVIVTVGAGAVLLLTGKPNELLADAAATSAASTPAAATSAASAPAAPLSGLALVAQEGAAARVGAFAGYSGQHGSVTVNSIATAGTTQLAVGSADGHPAIWHRGANGTWSLVSANQPAVSRVPGVEDLTGIAHGRAGWIAVGGVVSGTANHPVVVTSADGVTWHAVNSSALAGADLHVNAVAAGKDGYVIVGQEVNGARQAAALWWSPDLKSWVRGANGNLDGRLAPSAVLGVTATATGYVAVGTHGGASAIWTTGAGLSWTPQTFPNPVGGTSASLRFVATSGARIVAAGTAASHAGDIPIVFTSDDNGARWTQAVLPTAHGVGTVTALAPSGTGFAVAGLEGPAGDQHAVTWTIHG